MARETSRELTPTLLDRKLLEAAANGWSADEMGSKYGVDPAKAIVRVRELLSGRNVFDDLEKKQLLITSVQKLKEQIESATVDINNPKQVEAYLKVLKTIGDMLDRQGVISEAEMERATRMQARVILQMISLSYDRVREWLNEEYGSLVDVNELDQRFNIALREIVSGEDNDE